MSSNGLIDTNNILKLVKQLKQKSLKIASAESCTGGLIAARITEIPGTSEVFERGYVTYSNDAKIELLTVPTVFIEDFGAVSKQVAMAMAEGTLLMSKADLTISVTGIAGPDGGTEEKPVGTVFIGCAGRNIATTYQHNAFEGSRNQIRNQSVNAAINILLEKMNEV